MFARILGGDTVPSKVVLTSNDQLSHQSLALTWNVPKTTPEQYEITVYAKHEGENEEVERTYTTNGHETSSKIYKLDHSTEYFCVIVARYSDGKKGAPVRSNVKNTGYRKSKDFYKKNGN